MFEVARRGRRARTARRLHRRRGAGRRFNHASDLVSYIRDRKPGLKVFGACYPEGHYSGGLARRGHREPENQGGCRRHASDLQLFYDNDDFYRFLDKARAAGIDVPIEAGIMPVRGAKSVRRMAKVNASRIPAGSKHCSNAGETTSRTCARPASSTPPSRSRTSWPTAWTASTCIR